MRKKGLGVDVGTNLQQGHVAVSFISSRTGDEFVLDTWFTKGDSAGHILRADEWKNLKLDRKNDFDDLVPVVNY